MSLKVKYRVHLSFDNASTISSYLDWLNAEHGPDLLSVSGCEEYRVYEITPTQIDVEYLFSSKDKLRAYQDTLAPQLKKKALEKFPSGITYSRDESVLLASRSN